MRINRKMEEILATEEKLEMEELESLLKSSRNKAGEKAGEVESEDEILQKHLEM